MSDLIDRQIAISAICNACGKIDCDKMDKCEKLQLPSANNSETPNSSDTISRAKAIEAVMECYDNDELFEVYEDKLRELPPAQPEIIRCKDCKYARLTYDGSCKYCDIWFPYEAEYMDGDYYCASAERKSNG